MRSNWRRGGRRLKESKAGSTGLVELQSLLVPGRQKDSLFGSEFQEKVLVLRSLLKPSELSGPCHLFAEWEFVSFPASLQC
jgi:hypothetical protein